MDSNQNKAADTLTNINSAKGTAWQLIGLSPVLTDLTVDIETSLSVGRSDSNDLVLAASQISRQHAKLNRVGDQLYVQDLGSSNGTFVNGERISTEAHALQATDELAFADLLFMVINDRIDNLDADALLGTLPELENVTPSSTADTQLEPGKQAASVTPSLSAPVIDIVTTQDFLPKNQPTATTELPVTSNPIKEVAINAVEVKAANQTSNPTTTPTTMSATNSVVQEDKLDTPQPTMAPMQQAQTSPMSTAAVEQKPAAKKNASLAIIIVVIIALIIVATLFK